MSRPDPLRSAATVPAPAPAPADDDLDGLLASLPDTPGVSYSFDDFPPAPNYGAAAIARAARRRGPGRHLLLWHADLGDGDGRCAYTFGDAVVGEDGAVAFDLDPTFAAPWEEVAASRATRPA